MSSFFPFLRAISEFFLVELWSSFIWALDLIDFFLYWAGQPELADNSFKGSTELAKDSAWNQAPSLSDRFPRWKMPALTSATGFNARDCWWLNLPFPVHLESFPRFYTGHGWWQLQFSICMQSVPSSHSLWSVDSILSPSPKFHRNCWWLLLELE